jgi:hypothetical protein
MSDALVEMIKALLANVFCFWIGEGDEEEIEKMEICVVKYENIM